MIILSFSKADVKFAEWKNLTSRYYTIADALPTTSRVELINKIEFAKLALNENSKTFIVYVVVLEATELAGMLIHPSYTAHV